MEFWQLVRMVQRQWKLIAVLLAVCVVLSLFLNFTKVKLYESSALIRVSFSTTNPIEGPPDFDTKNTLFGTIQEAATSDLALRTIAQKNGMDSSNIKQLRTLIKVLPVNKSEFLKITVLAPSAKQAVNAANDLATYVRDASNKRWLDQLNATLSYDQDQLKLAQDNYDKATQAYEDAKKRYSDLESQANQLDNEERSKQIADANSKVLAAQDDYAKANSAIPKDNNAIDLAKNKLDSAQRNLDALQQAALSPADPVKQSQRAAELSQTSGLDDALNWQKTAKGRVDELSSQIDLAKSLQQFPDLHAASVSVVDKAATAEEQGTGLTLYVGLAVIVALGLGVALAVLINYLDRGVHSVSAARQLYNEPVIAGIASFRPVKKKKLLQRIQKRKAAQPEPQPISAEELTGLPEHAMEAFRMLGNSIIEHHRSEIPALLMPQTTAALPSGAGYVQSGEPEVQAKANGNGNGHGSNANLALAQLSELRGLTLDPGGTASPPRPLGLLVAANAVGAGKTTVASNLGIVLAEAGYRTLLVDCNRKNPALLSSFGLDGDGKGRGKKKDKADEAEQPAEIGRIYNTEYPELDLLPYSSLPAQVSGIVRPSDLTGLLQKYEGDYQLFICDTPALSEASDALGLVQHFPNILFVVDGRQAKVMQDKEKLETLTVGDAALEGLVVNWMQKRN